MAADGVPDLILYIKSAFDSSVQIPSETFFSS